RVEEVLRDMDFLVVQDIMLTETAKLAHVVFPATSWSEKDGTFLNAEGLKQKVYKVIKAAGDSIPDWQILRNLSRVMGFDVGAKNLEALKSEIHGISAEEGSKELRFNASPYQSSEETDTTYPMLMVTGNLMQHSGALSVMSKSLSYTLSDAFLQINSVDAEKYKITDDSFVRLSSKRGSVLVKARISEEIPEGAVFVPTHFPHAKINTLTRISNDGDSPISVVKIEATK
ncbi:hypothetical protein EP227_04185, partial [bacterium]